MKKFILIFLALIAVTTTFALPKEKFYGKWICENVVIEIKADTIFIDEIDNEGFGYTYDFNEQTNTFTTYDLLDKTETLMECVLGTENELVISFRFDNEDEVERYTYRRLKEKI